MSQIVAQKYSRVPGGSHGFYNVVTSIVVVEKGSDSVTLPRMAKTSGCVAQLSRPGDSSVTVSQSTATVVNLTNNNADRVTVMLVSLSNDPVPNPVGDGA